MRFLNLLKADARLHIQGSIWSTLAIVAFWMVIPLHSPYFFVLYIGGALLASSMFNDIHDPARAHRYLTLPCSNFEKWLSKWLISSFGFAVYLLGLFYVTSILKFLLPIPFISAMSSVAYPNLEHLGYAMLVFLPMNALVLVGASYFKRYVILKTGVIAAVVFAIVTKILFSLGMEVFLNLFHSSTWLQKNADHVLISAAIAVWAIFLLLTYALSFYFFKNSEIE